MVLKANTYTQKLPERHPLEQGLKLLQYRESVFKPGASRTTSIRTRIETIFASQSNIKHHALPERHPLEQGLKRFRHFGILLSG